MPIKPENRARYPKNWKTEIRPAILMRANHKCEFCGIPNHVFKNCHTGCYTTCQMQVEDWTVNDGHKVSKIVLTIAHLDHTPENCDPENLKALCQKCHLAYDAEHHKKNAAVTRLNRKNGGASLFEVTA